ncbi:helix-turn-helix domain-containing protein [Streptomyces formicae]|uniref:Putative DNA-binding protein n=1 Tax=Streptomyces formicae TaxID=1616117 RepID=A0A291QCM6_9ACTN|nr:helix-turn-helix transcriptional regulator [Streptomyces formicae]ATL29247.1 putative DNA-binding protein [Streptomyces formicae]
MPPRSQPTARQVRLGAELRKLREAAGMTAREAAQLMGVNPIQVSQIESGRAGVSDVRLRRLAAHYACADMELIDALSAMATERTRGWWEEYRGVLPALFLDLSELDHHAQSLQTIGTTHVPGLLQTPEYARAIYTFWQPELPGNEVELRVEHRMRRAEVLTRENPVPYTAVLHESVLRTHVADRRVTHAQLAAILVASERPHVTVRVIPFDVLGFAGAGATILYATGAVPALDTAQRDTPNGSLFLDAPAHLLAMRRLFRRVESMALKPEESRDLIHRMSKEL